jgi:tyrosine-protein phosphatase SIW14
MFYQRNQPAGTRRAAVALLTLGLLSISAYAADQVPGVGNFHQVNDKVYRGAQPTTEGFQNLSKLGIKTVIDLREGGSRSASEEKTVTAAGMRYISIPMYGLSTPSDQSVQKVLALFDDSSVGPVFVHCRRGADRTGTVCACYRIAHDHWENAKALAEARSLGMAWIEKAMQHYVMHFAGFPVPAGVAVNAVSATVQ